MYVSTSFLADAKAAETVLNSNLTTASATQSTSKSAATVSGPTSGSSSTDSVTLSAEAMAAIETAATETTSSETSETSSNIYAALDAAFSAALPKGSNTTITFSSSTGDTPVVTGTNGAALTAAMTGGSTTGLSAAEANFAQLYSAAAAEGPAARFYQTTGLDSILPSLTDDQKQSFVTAFNNKTLTIQSATDAAGVTWSGTTYSTTTKGDLGGESQGGTGTVDTSALLAEGKNVLVGYSSFFAPIVISW
jgi:hypothetical protein